MIRGTHPDKNYIAQPGCGHTQGFFIQGIQWLIINCYQCGEYYPVPQMWILPSHTRITIT